MNAHTTGDRPAGPPAATPDAVTRGGAESVGKGRHGEWRGLATGVALVLPTVEDTRAFGARLAAVLRPGDLIVLTGPLGAGKTALAQGIGAGLGVLGDVTSPTFVIARVHRPDQAAGGVVTMVHADAYRLGDVRDPMGEVDALDLDASLEDSVTLVEWGEGLVEHLADAYLEVRIDRREDDSRVVTLHHD